MTGTEEATVAALMARCLDDIASHEEIAELDRLLCLAGPVAAQTAVRVARFETALAEVAGAAHDTAPDVLVQRLAPMSPLLRPPIWLALGVVAAAAVVVCIVSVRAPRHPPPGEVESPGPSAALPDTTTRTLRFPDGSTALVYDRETLLELKTSTPSAVEVELSRGRARFEVVPRKERRFRVRAGKVLIEVLGTVFTVDLASSGGQVQVTVERGVVRVTHSRGERRLGSGESAMFEGVGTEVGTASPLGIAPPPPGEPTHAASDAGHPIGQAASPRGESGKRPPHPLAAQMDSGKTASETANVASEIGTLPATEDPVRALLKISDAARVAGRPDQAIVALRAILAKRPHDPRAPYATFMLGRVLLDQMNRPGEAAEVFATFRTRDTTSPLAADALAREAECWSRAGDHARAQDRARLYVSLYPHGPQIEAVRALVDGHD